MKLNMHNLSFKLAAPAVILFSLVVVTVLFYVPIRIKENTIAETTASAEKTVQQFKTLRKYYVQNIVKKVLGKGGIKGAINHKDDPNAIPLPATMIHDLSALLKDKGTSLSLFSEYPFPNRKNRKLDDFQKTAWVTLQKNSDKPYVQQGELNGQQVLRVAVADKMVSEVCVGCHNSHPDSPKIDWKLGDVRGVLEVTVPIDKQLAAGAAVGKEITILISVLLSAVLIITMFIYQRYFSRRLKSFTAAMENIAEGDGDLSQRLEASSQDELSQVASAFNTFTQKIEDMVIDIRKSIGSINVVTKEIARANIDLSQRTEEQASSLEETASSMEEMTSTVKQSADSARQANQLAMSTREQAEKGGQVVNNAITAMNGISESSNKIADIISVIDEIAFQTNLLALNAAVEAARAGEQGRGFAVVASEVRNLAGRSADAAKEIKELIEDSVERVEKGSSLVNESGKTLEEIVSSVKKVTDIVAEISAASHEQSSGIEQVNQAVMQMDEMTQQNAALVEEAAASSKSLENQATTLAQAMARFKTGNS